jgi:hypothetical protein
VPEVGLELSSGPCKDWEPAETCGIRSSTRAVPPGTRARSWTMYTPQFRPIEAFNRRPHPNSLLRYWNPPTTHLSGTTLTAEPLIAPIVPCRPIVLNHAARYLGVDGQAEVRTACHSDMSHERWAGPPRNQGATAPTPGTKTSQSGAISLQDEVFVPAPVAQVALQPLSPAGGPLPERRPQPTTTENQQHKGEGKISGRFVSRCRKSNRPWGLPYDLHQIPLNHFYVDRFLISSRPLAYIRQR